MLYRVRDLFSLGGMELVHGVDAFGLQLKVSANKSYESDRSAWSILFSVKIALEPLDVSHL
jgi:hypothetical protein